MLTLALLGFGLLLAVGASRTRGGPEQPIGPGSEAFETLDNGDLAYRRGMAVQLIRGLIGAVVSDAGAPNVLLVLRGPGGRIGPDQGGAYWLLERIHDEGYALWAPISFHDATAREMGAFLVYLPAGEASPSPDYARLIAPTEAWPKLR